jgi:hexokinase
LCSLYCANPLHVHKFCHYSRLDNIISVDIVKGRIKKKDPKEFCLDKDTRNSPSYEKLLNFIVKCIAKFIKDRNIRKQLPIAFIFPFPMKHESLTCGKLIRWTKEFEGTGAEGKDVVQLLKEAASRRQEVSIQQLQLLHYIYVHVHVYVVTPCYRVLWKSMWLL